MDLKMGIGVGIRHVNMTHIIIFILHFFKILSTTSKWYTLDYLCNNYSIKENKI